MTSHYYANAVMEKIASHGVDPYEFIYRAALSGDPEAIKVANVIFSGGSVKHAYPGQQVFQRVGNWAKGFANTGKGNKAINAMDDVAGAAGAAKPQAGATRHADPFGAQFDTKLDANALAARRKKWDSIARVSTTDAGPLPGAGSAPAQQATSGIASRIPLPAAPGRPAYIGPTGIAHRVPTPAAPGRPPYSGPAAGPTGTNISANPAVGRGADGAGISMPGHNTSRTQVNQTSNAAGRPSAGVASRIPLPAAPGRPAYTGPAAGPTGTNISANPAVGRGADGAGISMPGHNTSRTQVNQTRRVPGSIQDTAVQQAPRASAVREPNYEAVGRAVIGRPPAPRAGTATVSARAADTVSLPKGQTAAQSVATPATGPAPATQSVATPAWLDDVQRPATGPAPATQSVAPPATGPAPATQSLGVPETVGDAAVPGDKGSFFSRYFDNMSAHEDAANEARRDFMTAHRGVRDNLFEAGPELDQLKAWRQTRGLDMLKGYGSAYGPTTLAATGVAVPTGMYLGGDADTTENKMKRLSNQYAGTNFSTQSRLGDMIGT